MTVSAFTSSSSAAGGGRSTEISGEAVLLAASSAGMERGSSRRGFFLATGISSASCGDGNQLAAVPNQMCFAQYRSVKAVQGKQESVGSRVDPNVKKSMTADSAHNFNNRVN
jgi:hypothetical protein